MDKYCEDLLGKFVKVVLIDDDEKELEIIGSVWSLLNRNDVYWLPSHIRITGVDKEGNCWECLELVDGEYEVLSVVAI